MYTKININFDDKIELLKMLESIGTPFEMYDTELYVKRDNDLRIISALTLNGYNYSVMYVDKIER